MPTIRLLGRAGSFCTIAIGVAKSAVSKILNFTFNITLFVLVLLNIYGSFWLLSGGAR
jgi:hypothetical protein